MVFGMSIRELLLSVLLGLFGGMLLKAFYSMVRMKMPTSYGMEHRIFSEVRNRQLFGI